MLVVAYALSGNVDFDPYTEPLGTDKNGKPVFLQEIWPSPAEIAGAVRSAVEPEMFRKEYASVFAGDEAWKGSRAKSECFAWEPSSTYVKNPPFFENLPAEPEPVAEIRGARALAVLGDSVTTDHISPRATSPRTAPRGRT